MITRSEQIEEMKEKAYRHAFVNAHIEIDLPLEIRSLRKQRGWTQPGLAELTGMKQSRISAMEKPGGANFNLETLKRLAEVFDVALVVRFAPFSELLYWSDRFRPDDFRVPGFEEELPNLMPETSSSDAPTRKVAAISQGRLMGKPFRAIGSGEALRVKKSSDYVSIRVA